MNKFLIRVEMHGATLAQYLRLHARMEEIDCFRVVRGFAANGTEGVWQLPTAEYLTFSNLHVSTLRDAVKIIADEVHSGAWVLVTQVADQAWTTAPA